MQKKLNWFKKEFIFACKILFLLIVLTSCHHLEDNSLVEPVIGSRGQLESATWLGKFNQSYIQSLLSEQQVDLTLQYDINVYKIVYKTSDPKGNIVTASGVMFAPEGKDNLSLMSIQHGTQTKRSKVGSVNVQESFEGFIGGGLGYFTIEPDYLGLGESNIMHPYHYAKSSAETVIDFIRACRSEAEKLNIKLNGQVFLAGYSEGGYVTMAAHREIQKNYSGEIDVTASAPMAGAYDLYLTAQTILKNKTYDQPSFLAFLMVAYNNIYGWNNLGTVFSSSYAGIIPSLFDGTKTTNEIDVSLTTDMTKLFNQDFVNSFEEGTEKTLTPAFKENSLLDWTPTVPMRLYHGDADQFVPYQNSVEAKDYFISHGAQDVQLITIAGGNHYTAAVPSILAAVQWFDSIRLKKYNEEKRMLALMKVHK